jgi:hypothetical protein
MFGVLLEGVSKGHACESGEGKIKKLCARPFFTHTHSAGLSENKRKQNTVPKCRFKSLQVVVTV